MVRTGLPPTHNGISSIHQTGILFLFFVISPLPLPLPLPLILIMINISAHGQSSPTR
jgi:hypothetical protein